MFHFDLGFGMGKFGGNNSIAHRLPPIIIGNDWNKKYIMIGLCSNKFIVLIMTNRYDIWSKVASGHSVYPASVQVLVSYLQSSWREFHSSISLWF